MSNVVLFGASDFSKMMLKYIHRFTCDRVIAFTCNAAYCKESSIACIPVIPFEELEYHYPPEKYVVLPAIGYTAMNTLRQRIANDVEKKGYELYNFIHPTTVNYSDSIGTGNIVLENVTLGLNTVIGNGNIIFNSCAIAHDNIVGSYNHFSPGVITGGYVHVRNTCFLGLNATIKDHVCLADRTLVGAAAYLDHHTQEDQVYVPAKGLLLPGKKSIDLI